MKTILTALLLFVGMHTMADNYTYLTVSQTGGETSFSVSEIDKITFDASDMVLHLTSGTEQRLALSGLEKMFFSQEASAIAAVSKSSSTMRMDDGRLQLTVAPGERVTLYNIKGEQLFTTTSDAVYDMRALGRGVYIVRMGQEARKLMNK